ncbi:hypothetical protein NOCARDAX2BIS_540007 [Nocardioides sp. AX2bis]|nr:hypothetical protein NOCARDAX2BIS_540007 [Nocardioides sp. AX2bis]
MNRKLVRVNGRELWACGVLPNSGRRGAVVDQTTLGGKHSPVSLVARERPATLLEGDGALGDRHGVRHRGRA